jgi:hypothetical protein
MLSEYARKNAVIERSEKFQVQRLESVSLTLNPTLNHPTSIIYDPA